MKTDKLICICRYIRDSFIASLDLFKRAFDFSFGIDEQDKSFFSE